MGTRDKLKDEAGGYILTEDGEYIILEGVNRGRRKQYNFWMKYQLFYGRRKEEQRRRRKR